MMNSIPDEEIASEFLIQYLSKVYCIEKKDKQQEVK